MSGSASFSWTLPAGPPLTEAQRALVVEALPLAPRVARRLASVNPFARQHADDLEGVAREGLVWAVQHYDPARGSRWLSYAYGGALIRCRVWLRAMKLRETRELDFILSTTDDGDELTRLDLTPDPAPLADELLLRHQVLALVEQLPERERAAVRRHLDDSTLEDVAGAHGVVREAVRRWELSGVRLLREAVGLVPRSGRRKRASPPLGAERHLLELLFDGTPRSSRELAQLTGYTPQRLSNKLREVGAVPVGVGVDGRTVLWAFPRKAA